jgi:hypothetical protein
VANYPSLGREILIATIQSPSRLDLLRQPITFSGQFEVYFSPILISGAAPCETKLMLEVERHPSDFHLGKQQLKIQGRRETMGTIWSLWQSILELSFEMITGVNLVFLTFSPWCENGVRCSPDIVHWVRGIRWNWQYIEQWSMIGMVWSFHQPVVFPSQYCAIVFLTAKYIRSASEPAVDIKRMSLALVFLFKNLNWDSDILRHPDGVSFPHKCISTFCEYVLYIAIHSRQ